MIKISGIEIDDVVDARGWYVVEDFFNRIAVRVNKGHPVACLNILDDHVLDHGCFAHAGFSYNIDMPAAVICFNTKSDFLVAEIGSGKYVDWVFVWFHNFIVLALSANQAAAVLL